MSIFNKIKYLILVHKQELLVSVFVIALPFVAFGVAVLSHQFEHKVLVANIVSLADKGFKKDMQSALNNTRIALRDSSISDYITRNDVNQTAAELTKIANKYGLSTMMAADRNGITLARAPTFNKDDFIFQTIPWGREVARGKEVVMVGECRNYPLIIDSAVPIMKNGSVQGALFGGYILNNAYATEFKKRYLGIKEQVAFYSVKTGIYGNSFDDPTSERFLKLIFNERTSAVQDKNVALIAGHFKVGNTIYHVGNIDFVDINGQKTGGMFVFTPAHTDAPPIATGLVGIFLILILIKLLKKRYRKLKLFQIGIFIGATLLVLLSILISILSIRGFLYIPPPYINTIYNSTMAFYPNSDIFSGTNTQKIAIQITTGGEQINAAQATVKYNPSEITIDDIIMDNSFCDQQLVIEKSIDNVNGIVTISCIKPGGFWADNGILAELLIQPLHTGRVNIQFNTDNTSVLANDGLGTNVLRAVADGSYRFIASPQSSIINGKVGLFSFTHPNPTRWYNSKKIHIEWFNLDEYKNYMYSLDQNSDTIPYKKLPSDKKSADFTVQNDGTYYFHITPLKSGYVGPTSHLKILVDTTSPNQPEIQASATEVNVGDIVRFKFLDHGDNLSGLQKNFYVQFNDGTWLPTTPNLNIPFLETGQYKINLRVFDNAGNFSDIPSEINVK